MPALVLSDHQGAEVHRFAFSTPRRAWQACTLVRSQISAGSRRLMILGDLPHDSGFPVLADRIAAATVADSLPAHPTTDPTTDRHQ